MVSQFFYLPANQKVDEEVRIAYTQEKIKLVKDMLSEHFICPGVRPTILPSDQWEISFGRRVIINLNYWNKVIDEFQTANRCKIELIDYQYLLMQLFRDNGRKVSWLNHTIEISLYKE